MTLTWTRKAVEHWQHLDVASAVHVANNVPLLRDTPYPPNATPDPDTEGWFILRIEGVVVLYEVIAGVTIRILDVETT